MPKFKLIIFDIDGTLVNSYPAIISSFNYTMQKLGLAKQKSIVIRKSVGLGDELLLKPFVGNKNIAKAIKFYRAHHRKSLLKKTYFMPYAKQLLTYLKNKGYKLAIASNRPKKFSNILLKHLKIIKLFDYVLCKDELRFGKPHPSILNKIIHKFNISKPEALYVGDMAIDVCTGKRAGIKTFAVATGSSSLSELKREKPDFLAKNLSKMFEIL